jgi:hypothetical protein
VTAHRLGVAVVAHHIVVPLYSVESAGRPTRVAVLASSVHPAEALWCLGCSRVDVVALWWHYRGRGTAPCWRGGALDYGGLPLVGISTLLCRFAGRALVRAAVVLVSHAEVAWALVLVHPVCVAWFFGRVGRCLEGAAGLPDLLGAALGSGAIAVVRGVRFRTLVCGWSSATRQ